MTQEKFIELQSDHQRSGLSLKLYLQKIGICYSTYNYWRKKYVTQEEPSRDLAPINFCQSSPSSSSLVGDIPSGVSLLFPNGLRAHFGIGTEGVLMELLNKSLSTHVLPE